MGSQQIKATENQRLLVLLTICRVCSLFTFNNKAVRVLEGQNCEAKFKEDFNSESAMKRVDLAAEVIYRKDVSQNTNYNKVDFVINYMIQDGLVAVASMGKTYDDVQNIFFV